jgi:hypothetical protein
VFGQILTTKRANLAVDGGQFSGADTALLGRLFFLEAGIASREPDRKKSLAAMAQAHGRAVSTQSSHDARLKEALLQEDPLEREGQIARVRSETLYGIADRMMELSRNPGEKGGTPNRAMAAVHARAANNAGIAYEIRSIAALGGADALKRRTGLEGQPLADAVRRAGAESLLVEYHSRQVGENETAKEISRTKSEVEQVADPKSDRNPDKTWASRSVLMSEEDFVESVRSARDEAVEKMFPCDSDDRETRVRRAALDKFSNRARDFDIYGHKAKVFHHRILKGFPKDSSQRREMGAMMTAIELRGRQRVSQKDQARVM